MRFGKIKKKIYFLENIPTYELENKILNTKQGAMSINEYYLSLNGPWNVLDQYNQNFKMNCNEDSATMKKFNDRARIFKFLSGLNPEFDHIRIHVLSKDKLPSLMEVFNIVRGKESRISGSAESSPEDRCSHGKEKVLGSHKGGDKGVLKRQHTNQTVRGSEAVKDGTVLAQGEGKTSNRISKEGLERLQANIDILKGCPGKSILKLSN